MFSTATTREGCPTAVFYGHHKKKVVLMAFPTATTREGCPTAVFYGHHKKKVVLMAFPTDTTRESCRTAVFYCHHKGRAGRPSQNRWMVKIFKSSLLTSQLPLKGKDRPFRS